MQLIQAASNGVLKAGIKDVQAQVSGGLAQWAFLEGLGVDSKQVQVDTSVSFKLNKNWQQLSSISGGVKLKYNNAILAPSVTIGANGQILKANISFEIKW